MLEVRIARSVGSLQLDVDLSVSSGTVLVAGPNGAGKTTLLRLILGISRPDAGRILLDGRPLFDGRVDVPASAGAWATFRRTRRCFRTSTSSETSRSVSATCRARSAAPARAHG